ncbi:unnamed protein product [marine sediment metagenome]|uniref:F5/8 type C domain-containing protein n=1 Tax=marine sediment metagenome TaxID=412755 RepID=X0SBX7_9ZZZZ
MSNIRFLYTFKNDEDDVVITSSSESGTLVDDNVVDDFVAKKWRTEADTGQWIKFDLQEAKKITQISIFGHNLTSEAVVTIEASSDDDWEGAGDPEYSEGMTWGEFCITEFLDETFQWWRITIEDGDNSDEYIEIGRICIGEYIEPSINVTHEVQKKINDPSYKQASAGQQKYAVEKDVYRVFEVFFSSIGRAQQDQLEVMFRTVKTIRPLVLALDPDNYPEEDTIYCEVITQLNMAQAILGYGDVPISFEEKVG